MWALATCPDFEEAFMDNGTFAEAIKNAVRCLQETLV